MHKKNQLHTSHWLINISNSSYMYLLYFTQFGLKQLHFLPEAVFTYSDLGVGIQNYTELFTSDSQMNFCLLPCFMLHTQGPRTLFSCYGQQAETTFRCFGYFLFSRWWFILFLYLTFTNYMHVKITVHGRKTTYCWGRKTDNLLTIEMDNDWKTSGIMTLWEAKHWNTEQLRETYS